MAKSGRLLSRRNTAIVKRHAVGESLAAIARHFGVSRVRIREITLRANRQTKERAELEAT